MHDPVVFSSTEVTGVKMQAGQHVVLEQPIVNRDPRQFAQPDVFDPKRSPNRHFALGLGIHRCLGAHLVRVEARVACEEFFRRIPGWHLDPAKTPKWIPGQVAGMETVSIVFPRGGGHAEPDWTPGRPLSVV